MQVGLGFDQVFFLFVCHVGACIIWSCKYDYWYCLLTAIIFANIHLQQRILLQIIAQRAPSKRCASGLGVWTSTHDHSMLYMHTHIHVHTFSQHDIYTHSLTAWYIYIYITACQDVIHTQYATHIHIHIHIHTACYIYTHSHHTMRTHIHTHARTHSQHDIYIYTRAHRMIYTHSLTVCQDTQHVIHTVCNTHTHPNPHLSLRLVLRARVIQIAVVCCRRIAV